jgi:tRNA (cytidine/uridine-2'-O-)-methyltransferase
MNGRRRTKVGAKGFNIVLVEPEIPNNTGNIGRLCVGTHSRLHLVHPLGFEISDSRVKRAGLDYWPQLDLSHHESLTHVLDCVAEGERVFFLSSHAEHSLYGAVIKPGDWLVFGKESVGLPKELVEQNIHRALRIPFPGEVRSFNLSNAVSMVLGEGMRQAGL